MKIDEVVGQLENAVEGWKTTVERLEKSLKYDNASPAVEASTRETLEDCRYELDFFQSLLDLALVSVIETQREQDDREYTD